MTSDLTISSAVWACKQPGVPLVAGIVEGGGPCDHKYLCCEEIGCHGPNQPPADLVALRDAQCGTCGGSGIDPTPPWTDACPTCDNERPLVDVRVEMIPYSYHGDPCPCGLPADEHYRTVKGLVDVVPVVDICDPRALSSNGQALVVMDDGGVALVDAEHELDLTPAHVEALGTIQPEQWAWTFTEVEA